MQRKKEFEYLATPYSHSDFFVRERRYQCARWLVAKLLQEGRCVVSPIVSNHEIAVMEDMPFEAKDWEDFNFELLLRADRLLVGMFSGWEDSQGVNTEIRVARRLSLPVDFIDPKNYK